MKTLATAFVAATLVCAAPLAAQEHGHAQGGGEHHPHVSQFVTSLDQDIATVERKLVALAEAMPEESWSWRPGEGVRSVGEVFLHVAADNYLLPAFMGVAAPAETGVTADYSTAVAFETRQIGKAETIAALRASFAHLRGALGTVNHETLMSNHDFFGNPMTAMRIWVLTTTHLHEHLGQSIAYARSNGVVPPWSQGS